MQGSVSRKIVEGKPKALYLDPGLEAALTAGQASRPRPSTIGLGGPARV